MLCLMHFPGVEAEMGVCVRNKRGHRQKGGGEQTQNQSALPSERSSNDVNSLMMFG